MEIAPREEEQRADTAAEKAPEVLWLYAKGGAVRDENRDGKAERRHGAAHQNRALSVNADRGERAREKAHRAPETAGGEDGQDIFFHNITKI